jgi:putative FmdB family regulatory protein
MIYTYKCYDCEHQFDTEQSVKDKPLKKCPHCKNLSIERLIYSPMVFVRQEAKTIGQLADRNSKKLGTGEISERDAKKKETAKNFFDKERSDLNKKISSMTPEQKDRYIYEGKL